MRTIKNEGGGKSVVLAPGDNLKRVRESHRMLITPRIKEAFADASEYFRSVAVCCPFPSMAAWLKVLIEEGDWELVLHRGVPEEWTAAGIRWWSEKVRSAEITPASESNLSKLPPALRRYYSLVDQVSWMPFGCAGGLYGITDHTPLTNFYYTYHGADIKPAKTFVFGSSSCGDMVIYTADGRGGWLCHEDGKIHLLGTIEDTIEWVYCELLANRSPEFDYGWA